MVDCIGCGNKMLPLGEDDAYCPREDCIVGAEKRPGSKVAYGCYLDSDASCCLGWIKSGDLCFDSYRSAVDFASRYWGRSSYQIWIVDGKCLPPAPDPGQRQFYMTNVRLLKRVHP